MNRKKTNPQARPKHTQAGSLSGQVQEFRKRKVLGAVQRHRDLGKAAGLLGMTPGNLRVLLHGYGIGVRTKVTRTQEVVLPKR